MNLASMLLLAALSDSTYRYDPLRMPCAANHRVTVPLRSVRIVKRDGEFGWHRWECRVAGRGRRMKIRMTYFEAPRRDSLTYCAPWLFKEGGPR